MFSRLLSYLVYLVPCHRKPERCLKFNGKPMRICARCFSMLMGYLFIPFLLFKSVPILVGVLCQLPMLLDGFTQMYKLRSSNNYLRVLTGLTSGFGMSVCIVGVARLIIDLITKYV